MKSFILSLFFVCSVVSAGVSNNRHILREYGSQRNGNDVRNNGAQRISQMTHENLLQQKFLLDLLQNVQDPNVSGDILPAPVSQYAQLVDDQTLYNEVIDDLMANVLELSRSQELLSKAETFTIANDEHVRQMVGLYRVLVRSGSWDTLKRNLIHARLHVNGVLFVNSLLLAIQDREDTQHLIMPGIHEILPELYLDEDVLRRAQDIHWNQLINTSQTVNRKTQRPSLLEMIGINKLWNRNANGVNTLDRRELWMPWREMRNELQMRRVGGANSPMQITRRDDDDRIILPVTLSSNQVREELEVRLLTKDVGFQSYLQNLVNDLCLKEKEATLGNRQRRNRVPLVRVGLERNVGSMLESGIRTNQQQMEEQYLRELTNGFINNERMSGDNDDVDSSSQWRQRGSTVNDNIRIRNENVWRSNSRKQDEDQLPTTTADDKRLLYVNRNRQRAAAINQMYLRGEQPRVKWSSDDSEGLNDRWEPVDVGGGRRQGSRTHFMDTINAQRVGLRDDLEIDNEESRNMDQHMDMGTGMPMDWNRQMAMHRQRMNQVNKNQRTISQNWLDAEQPRNGIFTDLPEIDINDEHLLSVGRRRLNQLRKSDEQTQNLGDDDRNDDDNQSQRLGNQYVRRHQGWLNAMQLNSMQDTANDGRIVARGMGNIDIHVGQEGNMQSGVENNDKDVRNIGTAQLRDDQVRGKMNQWGSNGNRQQVNRWENGRDVDVQDVYNRIGTDIWRHRSPRSVRGVNAAGHQRLDQEERVGELILHNLQQLVARINMEHIALNIQDYTTPRINNPRLANAADERLALRFNERRLNARQTRMLLEQVSDIENRLQMVIHSVDAEQIKDAHTRGGDIDRLIGDVLISRQMTNENVNLLNVLAEVISQNEGIRDGIQTLSQISIDIENPVVLHLLRRIVRMVDIERQQQLGSYRKEELQMDGVRINDVKVDKLRTYVDTNDVDLINALDAKSLLTANRNGVISQRMVVARQQRLNHQTFTINIDVTSDRNQRVVVRTLLGPKKDVNDVASQLSEQRQNFVLLDTQMVDLHIGRNVIKRKSQDINWTARDTTPFTEIYKRVMNALNGQLEITKDQVQGQNCHFPHRLLLPRGRPEGLPMQIFVIITPVETEVSVAMEEENRVCGMGISNVNLDQQPLGFPLDRPIDDVQQVMSLPNVHLMDVKLFHSKQLVADDFF